MLCQPDFYIVPKDLIQNTGHVYVGILARWRIFHDFGCAKSNLTLCSLAENHFISSTSLDAKRLILSFS